MTDQKHPITPPSELVKTELSPAVQAVLDAYIAGLETNYRSAVAAALRAAGLYCKQDRIRIVSELEDLSPEELQKLVEEIKDV